MGPDRHREDRRRAARRVRALRGPARAAPARGSVGRGGRRRARGVPRGHGPRAERRAAARRGAQDPRLVPALYRTAKRMTLRLCVGRSLFWLASSARGTAPELTDSIYRTSTLVWQRVLS